MYLLFILIVFIGGITAEVFGQSLKSKRKTETAQQPTSLNPANPQKEYAPNSLRKSSRGSSHDLEEEYHQRMASLQKTRKKDLRLMAKPQFSDPLYFGHKKLPKKRKPSRMKFCNECGIRH